MFFPNDVLEYLFPFVLFTVLSHIPKYSDRHPDLNMIHVFSQLNKRCYRISAPWLDFSVQLRIGRCGHMGLGLVCIKCCDFANGNCDFSVYARVCRYSDINTHMGDLFLRQDGIEALPPLINANGTSLSYSACLTAEVKTDCPIRELVPPVLTGVVVLTREKEEHCKRIIGYDHVCFNATVPVVRCDNVSTTSAKLIHLDDDWRVYLILERMEFSWKSFAMFEREWVPTPHKDNMCCYLSLGEECLHMIQPDEQVVYTMTDLQVERDDGKDVRVTRKIVKHLVRRPKYTSKVILVHLHYVDWFEDRTLRHYLAFKPSEILLAANKFDFDRYLARNKIAELYFSDFAVNDKI